jgi:hypothetical protein
MDLKPDYPQKPLLPKITHHETLPSDAVELARINDRLNFNDLRVFLKIEQTLVIVKVSGPGITKNPMYVISQFELPLGFLPWFADALNGFRKPPAEGGLHAGAMTSADEDVEGEMLCIQRAMDAGNGLGGYVVVNRSRTDRLWLDDPHDYRASEITFPENFLYEGGLLQLITELGEKYRKGLL